METRLIELIRLCFLKYGSTDIHFSSKYQEVEIQARIDGHMRKVRSKFEDYKLIRYLMYLANLDVGNYLIPQTGQFEMEVDNQLLNMRFAVIQSSDNTVSGVLRLLNNQTGINYEEPIKSFANDVSNYATSNKPGLFLISGPTGSGKTTLAYSILKSLKNVKAYSCEDPVEIYIDSIIQLDCNESCGLTMGNLIKQVLRHDPTIINCEIKDEESAKNAVIAANTGHTVLASLHAGSCESAVNRIIEYGVDENHLKENLCSVINLRLEHTEGGEIKQPATIKSFAKEKLCLG